MMSPFSTCCDLLENTYLCGSNNNLRPLDVFNDIVVICLKIRTFVVATTTPKHSLYRASEL